MSSFVVIIISLSFFALSHSLYHLGRSLHVSVAYTSLDSHLPACHYTRYCSLRICFPRIFSCAALASRSQVLSPVTVMSCTEHKIHSDETTHARTRTHLY